MIIPIYDPAELFENVLVIFSIDAGAGIGDSDADLAVADGRIIPHGKANTHLVV